MVTDGLTSADFREEMMSSGAVTLGDIAGKITMLEVACSRCERRGRLSVDHQQGRRAQLVRLWRGEAPV